jgi:hypothetical protein
VYYGFKYEGGRTEEPMRKFTFTMGEDEGTFVVAGEYYQDDRYWDYKITGSWSPPLEDGKIPVKMKFNEDTGLEGIFDPEENSIRGETIETYGTPRTFVFKRDPDFVRFYPAPCVINARTRWGFATASVLDRIRQRAWSSKRILKKMKDRRRFTELSLREHCGKPLRREERDELFAFFPGLYKCDMQFYGSLINLHLKKIAIFE